jgi:UDPglucose 6-dehydrogenase
VIVDYTPKVEKIAIIGAGYVGLTTAACFAKMGHRVILSEIDPGKRDHIRNGISPILEPGLAEILAEVTASGHLSVTSDNFEAASSSDFVFICLPTPQAFDGSADTSVIFDVIRSIASAFTPNTVLITKSTMPVGSVKTIQDLVHDTGAIVATNPEFLREGTAVDDTLHPERIVIGCNDGQSADRITELYASLESQIFVTDPQSAELIKYASNAFLATKVTFINSVATLCDAVGADIASVSCALGSDSRIGSKFLTPGPGWGGSCFPKDTSALLHLSDRIGHSFKLLDAVISGNLDHQLGVVQQIVNVLGENGGNRVAVLGLTFKAGTDDLRDSPAIFIIRQLLKLGIIVTAYDPTVTTELHASLDSVNICFSAKQAAVSADLIVVLTEWPEFSELDPSDLMSVMANRNIFDTRGIINKETWISSGFSVRILGRP